MTMASRIAEQVARLPAELKAVLDRETAAGNAVAELEIDRSPDGDNVVLRLENAFHIEPDSVPSGVAYKVVEHPHHWVYQYYTAGERFSLITVKFKPMILPTLGEGPPDPTEAHIARMKEIAERDAARAAERAAEAANPVAPVIMPGLGDAANRFVTSMTMTFEMWHDGTGYDLAMLREIPPAERDAVESILIRHDPRDWRDIEALAQIDSPKAREAVEEALHSPDPKVREEAMRHIPEQINSADRERLLLHTLNTAGLYDGLSQAIDEAAEFHPPAVIDALIRGSLNRDGEAAVHFAALLFYVHGKAPEPFDWNQRPFFLRFNTFDRAERHAVFRELCERTGLDAAKYL